LSESFLFSQDSFFTPIVGNSPPLSEESGKSIPIDSVPGVGSNSLLLLLSLKVDLPDSKACAIES